MKNNRPQSWSEFQGQTRIINNLQVYVKAAYIQNTSIDHILISGPSGMGKTSLAYLIAKVLDVKLHVINGANLQKQSDLISIITTIKDRDIVFIDEIHAMNKEIYEIIYPILEENKMNIIIGKDYNSKVVNIDLPKFTLIGATTEINKLSTPLINRFPINFTLEEYSIQDLSKIVEQSFNDKNLTLSDDCYTYVAQNSRDTPRIAINLVKRIIDFNLINQYPKITVKNIANIFEEMGIFENGLNQKDISYLSELNNHTKIGLESISQILNIPTSTLTNIIEPLLLRKRLIHRTHNGRIISEYGKLYLKNIIKN